MRDFFDFVIIIIYLIGGFTLKLKFMKLTTIITLTVLLVFGAGITNSASAALADGTYSVGYQVLKAENNNASIANGYFEKPATVTVENGVQYVQITVTSASMVQSLSGPNGKATVVSENQAKDTKVLKFKVADISKPVQMKMHIIVDAGDIQYDTDHGARFVFDPVSSGSSAVATPATSKGESTQSNNMGEEADNPKTSDETPVLLFSLLLIGSGLFIARKVVLNKNSI